MSLRQNIDVHYYWIGHGHISNIRFSRIIVIVAAVVSNTFKL